MKKIILMAVTVAAAAATMNVQAAAVAVCAGAGTATPQVSATDSFIKTPFTPKCSNNVHLMVDDQTTFYRVGAASVKGKNGFGGSTAGGAVSVNGACAATGCTATDASAAATNASSA